MNKKREFRFDRGRKLAALIWTIEQKNDSYETIHGQLGGAMQINSDRPGDKGKVGTKGYVDSIANATFNVEREIRKKTEHGYIEYVDGKPTEELAATAIDFNRALPKNFCSYKPNGMSKMPGEWLENIVKKGTANFTRKMDGMMHLAVHHPAGWEMYTRRMDLASERFPEHIVALERIGCDVGTILVGEMVSMTGKNNREDFKDISRICRSLPEETRKLISSGELPEPKFVIYDILFHNGKDLKNTSYADRRKIWSGKNWISLADAISSKELIVRIDYFDLDAANWEARAVKENWEGFVITDGNAIPGDNFYSFNGKAKRPKGHYKLKPYYEEDVVVFAASTGTGKRMETVGALHIKQIHPETGKWFYCGKVGTGPTEEDLVDFYKRCKKLGLPILEKDKDAEKMELDNVGFVVEVKYPERISGTNKFRFPVFMRCRDDKTAEECEAQRLAPEDEE